MVGNETVKRRTVKYRRGMIILGPVLIYSKQERRWMICGEGQSGSNFSWDVDIYNDRWCLQRG